MPFRNRLERQHFPHLLAPGPGVTADGRDNTKFHQMRVEILTAGTPPHTSRAGGDDRVVTNRHARQNRDVASQPNVSADHHRRAAITLLTHWPAWIIEAMVTGNNIGISTDQRIRSDLQRFVGAQIAVAANIDVGPQFNQWMGRPVLGKPKSTIPLNHTAVPQVQAPREIRSTTKFYGAMHRCSVTRDGPEPPPFTQPASPSPHWRATPAERWPKARLVRQQQKPL